MTKKRSKEPNPEQYDDTVAAFRAHGIELRRAGRIGEQPLQYVLYPWAGGYRTLHTFGEVLDALPQIEEVDLFK